MSKNLVRIFTVSHGNRVFLGTIDVEKRLYQRGLSLDRYLFRPFGEPLYLTFELKDEWFKIRERVGTIEHLDIDHPSMEDYRVYRVPLWVARRVGQTIETRWGKKWGIPFSAFDVVTKDGSVEVAGTPR